MAKATYHVPLLGANTHPSWQYPPGTVRWRRLRVDDLKTVPGWTRQATLLRTHPITGEEFTAPQHWLREFKT